MKLSILIVNWNTRDLVVQCVNSILQNRPSFEFEVIVVDNGSRDGSSETLTNFFGVNRRVQIIQSLKNLGFSKANNLAYRKSSGEYIFMLNPDTEVRPGAIESLVKYLDDHPDVGVVGPMLLNRDGSLQESVRRFPGIWASLVVFSGLHRIAKPRRYLMKKFDYQNGGEVDQVMGAALLTRRKIIETLGFLDEIFWLWYEEVDFCYRVKGAGYKVVYYPGAQIQHARGEGFKQMPTMERKRTMARSLIHYFKKNGKWYEVWLISVCVPAVFVIASLVNLLEKTIGFKLKPKT